VLNNGNLSQLADRVNPASTLNMRGGTFSLFGGSGGNNAQALATVNLVQGGSIINANAAPIGSADITVGNLTRSPGAIVFFQTQTGTLGNPGSNLEASHIFLNKINGTNFSQANLVNGIIGGWAVCQRLRLRHL
jgi:hypothetical protein